MESSKPNQQFVGWLLLRIPKSGPFWGTPGRAHCAGRYQNKPKEAKTSSLSMPTARCWWEAATTDVSSSWQRAHDPRTRISRSRCTFVVIFILSFALALEKLWSCPPARWVVWPRLPRKCFRYVAVAIPQATQCPFERVVLLFQLCKHCKNTTQPHGDWKYGASPESSLRSCLFFVPGAVREPLCKLA